MAGSNLKYETVCHEVSMAKPKLLLMGDHSYRIFKHTLKPVSTLQDHYLFFSSLFLKYILKGHICFKASRFSFSLMPALCICIAAESNLTTV